MQLEHHPEPLHIFLSFAHEDRKFRDVLDKHLTALQRIGLISDWHKHEILPGDNWQDATSEQLNQAEIILLFITIDYIASFLHYEVQMKQALVKHETGEARVIPILFRPINWLDYPFLKLQGLPMGGAQTVDEWKNKDLAYVNIIEGIKRVIDDFITKRTAKLQSPSYIWGVPYKRNKFFTARNSFLDALHETFVEHRKNDTCTQAISGLSGSGKTQIALEYTYRYKGDYQAIFWLNGDTPENFYNDITHIATLLDLPEKHEADQQIIMGAIKRSLLRIPGWLIIIDNLDILELVEELQLVEGHGDILITTHRQAVGTIATLQRVEKMMLDEGTLFLLFRAGITTQNTSLDELPTQSVADARTICQLVDGHALALDQAGAYIEKTRISLPRYITLYQKHKIDLLRQRGKSSTGHQDSIATTLNLCITQAKQQNPVCLEILSICAFWHPDAIPVELFSGSATDLGPTLQALMSNELEFNDALAILLDLSLLHRNSDTEIISLHHLVQIIIQNEMDTDIQRIWAERAVKVLSHLFPEPEPGVWQRCQQYLPHVFIASKHITQWNLSCAEATQLLSKAGRYLYAIAHYAEAQTLCEQALTINEYIHGNDHAEAATILHCLGNIDESLGNNTRARHYYEQARTISEQEWGSEHPYTADILNDLGELAQTSGQFSLAEDYYKQALTIREKVFGSKHPYTASSINNLAGIHEEQGNLTQAEHLYEEALQLRKHSRGPEHIDTAESYSNVARFYRIMGKYYQAWDLYKLAIATYTKALGPDHPRVATSYNNFAVFCMTLGRYIQAERLLIQALEIRIPLFGRRHPSTVGSWNHLAKVYTKQGHYEQARTLYEQALLIDKQTLGRHHPSTIAIITNMAELHLAQGDTIKAEMLLTETLTSLTEENVPRALHVATILNLLGGIYLAREEYERAELSLTEGLTIRQQAIGTTHPETAQSLKSLGDLARANNNTEQAAIWYRQALEIIAPVLGPHHPDVMILTTSLESLLKLMGQDDEVHKLTQYTHYAPAPWEEDQESS